MKIAADDIFGVCCCHLVASLTNIMDPNKTAPIGFELYACKL